jgi:hypothetical protein
LRVPPVLFGVWPTLRERRGARGRDVPALTESPTATAGVGPWGRSGMIPAWTHARSARA